MRIPVTIFILLSFVLNACAPGEDGIASSVPPLNETGLYANNGAPYTIGGDKRVAPATQQLIPHPSRMTPEEKNTVLFSESLENFQFLRFGFNESQPSRFGKDHFTFDVQRRNGKGNHVVIRFAGRFVMNGNSVQIKNAVGDKPGYTLDGDVTDGKETSIGTFTLHQNDRQATIFLRAYRAKTKLHRDRSQDLSKFPQLLSQISSLEASKYAWVTNMVVVPMGVSLFHYDILSIEKVGEKSGMKPVAVLSFSGESVETGDVDAPPSVINSSQSPEIQSVTLAGDGEDQDSRVFSMQLKDKKGASTEVMMDVERDVAPPENLLATEPFNPTPEPAPSPKPAPVQPSAPQPAPPQAPAPQQPAPPLPPKTQERPLDSEKWDVPKTANQPKPHVPVPRPRVNLPPPSTPAPAEPKPDESYLAPRGFRGIGPNAFFQTRYGDPRLPRTKIATEQFERNYHVRQVQEAIREYRRSRKMANFYIYGYPFVTLIESIAETYDVPPAFAFLLMVETEYFNASSRLRPYTFATPRSTTASGPFQLVYGTARANGMAVIQNAPGQRPAPGDERNYFAPSACAAAHYLGRNIDLFKSGDATLGFMAYFQGEGNVEKVVARVRRLGGDFSYDYATIARNNMIKRAAITYVAHVLAAYFISGDYRKYGFSLQGARTSLPGNAVPREIRSRKCESAVARTRLT